MRHAQDLEKMQHVYGEVGEGASTQEVIDALGRQNVLGKKSDGFFGKENLINLGPKNLTLMLVPESDPRVYGRKIGVVPYQAGLARALVLNGENMYPAATGGRAEVDDELSATRDLDSVASFRLEN